MARSRGTLIDQVNPAGEGLPYFTPKTLNPIWDAKGPIVRMPAAEWTDHNGVKRDASLFQGKVSILAFMFTSCSGFCPFVVRELQNVARATTNPRMQYIAITVDPEFDTTERLKSFADAHGVTQENWFFLRGAAVQSLIKDTLMSQVIQRPLTNGRDFVHAGHFYVIDEEGRLRAILNGTEINVAAQAQNLLKRMPPTL